MNQGSGDQIKRAIVSWEKLRLIYNVVLLLEGLFVSWCVWSIFESSLQYVWAVVVFGLTANAFYCMGPLVEVYASVIYGRRLGRYRYLLFAAGLLFSMIVIAYLWFVLDPGVIVPPEFVEP